MAYGRLIELNRFTPKVNKNLLLRLYETPKAGESCGLEGQFISAEWKEPAQSKQPPQGDEASLLITYSVFAAQASKTNPKLGKERRTVTLHVDLKGITEQSQ